MRAESRGDPANPVRLRVVAETVRRLAGTAVTASPPAISLNSLATSGMSRPLALPPTNDKHATSSLRTKAELSCSPDPLTSETGSPARRASAIASVSV